MDHKERMLQGLPYKAWMDGLSEERAICREKIYRNCARKPIPSLPGFSRGMNGACVAKHIAV